jgi:N utilization substance protein B
MITRSLLRTKAAQVLYATFQSGNLDIRLLDDELNFSIQKSYDLYHFLLLLPQELTSYAYKKLDNAAQKLLKSDDMLAYKKIALNSFSKTLANNTELQEYAKNNAVIWINLEATVKDIYKKLIQTSFFKHYIKVKESNFEEDRNFWRKFYKSTEIFDEKFEEFMEDESIYWIDDLDVTLSFVAKTIKPFQDGSLADNHLLPLYKNENDRSFIIQLAHHVFFKTEEYDGKIEPYLKNWSLERLALIDVVLLKMAIAEMEMFRQIPKNVTIDEYVEIAKYYGTENSPAFINGVLNSISETIDNGISNN